MLCWSVEVPQDNDNDAADDVRCELLMLLARTVASVRPSLCPFVVSVVYVRLAGWLSDSLAGWLAGSRRRCHRYKLLN